MRRFDAALLSIEQMSAADRLAIAGGTPGTVLMENAGRGVAELIMQRWTRRPTLVLCGPGNNGGDGFVVGRILAAAGWPVRLALLGSPSGLKGDAAVMAQRWSGPVLPLGIEVADNMALVVDAVFGAGLTRDIEGSARALIEALSARDLPLVAIDVPSGIDGNSGAIRGAAFQATVTATFFRAKPGHWLLPGRLHCGELAVLDIGIAPEVLAQIGPDTFANSPSQWRDLLPWPQPAGHKYSRGHALVMSGPAAATGAARLAARAALRVGSGLVTLASPLDAVAINAGQLTAVMVAPCVDPAAWSALLEDARKTAILLGPGNGVTAATRDRVLAGLKTGRGCVLDADALTVFADDPDRLFAAISGPCVLTPHDGEFRRLFPSLQGDKVSLARAAARQSGAVIVLKGFDSVIASPAGDAFINCNGSPWLASAGTGDVLAGLIVGLVAAGMPAFEAAAAGVWIHGAAGSAFGPGLIAEDLPERVPEILRGLAQSA